ncbi:unnamed protein product [Acanthoscelides obtectus]|uniref:Fibronectin type-III domain-containing protein n=1 Tax=Acanthoscelides obtectus TaxID=200917 RepID=A0A9P0L512_ACAOB|nr:unnamed protein product [Acanthoscelides obtectus]CAK1666175.1 Cytokine receptor-like factor 3 [Acanthoscelides obtectus]
MDKEVEDTVKEAKLYLNKLTLLDNDLEAAIKQITTTFEETNKNIRETFSNLKATLIKILDKREELLLNQSKKIKGEAIVPLNDCRKVVQEKMKTTNKLIDTGSVIMSNPSSNFDCFMKDASLLGSLPEVPQLKEVPYISFHSCPSSENEVKNILEKLGEVSRIAPAQVTQMTEKPGAILVEWQIVENDERMTDIQEFKLQRAFGDVTKDLHLIVNFNDCYKGPETQHLVKDLQPGQPYSFRVACKFEGIAEWSAWSLPQVSSTRLKPFSWEENAYFETTGENKIAKPCKDDAPIIFSNGAQFFVGHSIEFTFLETDTKPSKATIGLVTERTVSNLRSLKEGSFLINQSGLILVDGVEKSTVLPAFAKGQKVTISTESPC